MSPRPIGTRPFTSPVNPQDAAIKSARELIRTATLTGANDRNLLHAARTLRNAMSDGIENRDLWKAGAEVFDKLAQLHQQAGRPAPQVERFAEAERAIDAAKRQAAGGDAIGALRMLRHTAADFCEYEPLWRAGLEIFDKAAGGR